MLKFIEETERNMCMLDGSLGGLPSHRRILSKAEEHKRKEKMDKPQKMLHRNLDRLQRNSGGMANPFPIKVMFVFSCKSCAKSWYWPLQMSEVEYLINFIVVLFLHCSW